MESAFFAWREKNMSHSTTNNWADHTKHDLDELP